MKLHIFVIVVSSVFTTQLPFLLIFQSILTSTTATKLTTTIATSNSSSVDVGTNNTSSTTQPTKTTTTKLGEEVKKQFEYNFQAFLAINPENYAANKGADSKSNETFVQWEKKPTKEIEITEMHWIAPRTNQCAFHKTSLNSDGWGKNTVFLNCKRMNISLKISFRVFGTPTAIEHDKEESKYYVGMVTCASGFVVSVLLNVIICVFVKRNKKNELLAAAISRRKELGTITHVFLPPRKNKNAATHTLDVNIAYNDYEENNDGRAPNLKERVPVKIPKPPKTRSPNSSMKPVLQLIPGYNVNKKSKSESKRNSCSSVKDLIHLGKQLNSKENNVLSEDIYVNRDMIQAKNIDVDLKPPLPDDVTISEKTTERISPQVPEDGAEKEELYLSLINIEDDVAGFQKQICNR